MPASLFRRGSFATGLLVCLVVFSSVAALFLVLTTQLQTGHGYSALQVGLTFMAWPVGLALSSGVAIRLFRTAGARVIGAGCLILTAAMAALVLVIGRSGEPSWPLLVGCLFAGGLGSAWWPRVDIVLGTVPARDAGAGREL